MTKFVVKENIERSFALIKQAFLGKQDALVSGTNIKTVNGSSLLGSGNLAIESVDLGTASLVQDTGTSTTAVMSQNATTNLLVGMYQAAGAEYNSTSNSWTVNGLSGITWAQMHKIYAESIGFIPAVGGTCLYRLAYASARTNLLPGAYNGGRKYSNLDQTMTQIQSGYLCYYTSFEVVRLATERFPKTNCRWNEYRDPTASNTSNIYNFGWNISPTNGSGIFTGSNSLKAIIGVLGFRQWTSAIAASIFNCPKLERVLIYGLGVNISLSYCPNLTPASVLFMITYAQSGKTLTITLHATAYANAMADSDVTTALANNTNITLASA